MHTPALSDPPLAGVRVVEIGSFIAAPLAATLLADHGADVVKVEPLAGDAARTIGAGAERGMSATFLAANRGKRSLALDLSGAEGAALLRSLVDGSDVLVHNLTPGFTRRLGIDPAALAERAPRVVSCAVSAFGTSGPLAGRRALDPVVQAMSGLAAATGDPDGPPMRCAAPVVDVSTALAAYGAIVTGLVAQARGVRPAPVEVALYDVALLLGSPLLALRSLLGHPPPRLGNGSFAVLGDQFATRDGFLALAVWDEDRWRALCALLGTEDLGGDPRFGSVEDRHDNYAELRPRLAAAIASWDAATLEAALLERGIACGVTADLDDVATHAHALASGALYDEGRVDGPAVRLAAAPVREDGRRPCAPTPPPALGAGGPDALRDRLGLSTAEVDALVDDGVVGRAGAPAATA